MQTPELHYTKKKTKKMDMLDMLEWYTDRMVY
jgi:hypothetical protein